MGLRTKLITASLILALSVLGYAHTVKGEEERPSVPHQINSCETNVCTDPTVGMDMHQYLRFKAGDNYELLNQIIICESGWKPDIKNSQSTASGLAQFLNSTWTTTRQRMGLPDPELKLKHDWREHIDTFVWLFEHDGSRHWNESKSCWVYKS